MSEPSPSTVELTSKPGPTRELYAALLEAQKHARNAQKGGTNAYDSYRYSQLEDFLEVTRGPMHAAGLVMIHHPASDIEYGERQTKSGGREIVARVKLKTTLIHPESGGELSVVMVGEGQDRGDKAAYKAITGARKYAIACLFAIHTTDDPETSSHDEPAPDPQQPATTPPPWSPGEQGKLRARLSSIYSDEEHSAAEKLRFAIAHLAKLKGKPSDEQFKELCETLIKRADELLKAGDIDQEYGNEVLQQVATDLLGMKPASQVNAPPAAEQPPEAVE